MSQSHDSHSSSHPSVSAGEALARLHAGNESFRASRLRSEVESGRYQELLEGQHPFAAVLCCSDSRVPPELIFDRGLGELFVIRNPGNVLHDVVLGSIEYAVDHLGIQLIVVLGHEKCGAITATVASYMEPVSSALTLGHLASIVNRIRPALEKVCGQEGDLVANTIDAHIVATVASLKADPLFAERMEHERLQVVGMRYNLRDGTVTPIA